MCVNYAAGIGGGNGGASSNITISGGLISATGRTGGAGIGGGKAAAGSDIKISGGTVSATGSDGGAGIGGGGRGAGSNIIISGGTVIATGGVCGAGIGGGEAAAGSVPSNIAEGFERDGNKEFVKFLYIAKGSVGEVQSQLYNAQDLGYVTAEEMSETYDFAHRISAGIHALICSLTKASRTGRRYEHPRNPVTPQPRNPATP